MKVILEFRRYRDWFSTLPVFLLLISIIIAAHAELLHTRLLNIGEWMWHDYFILRADIPTPSCHPDSDINAQLKKLEKQASQKDELDELFDSEPFNRQAAKQSLLAAQQLCRQQHQLAQKNQAKVTWGVRAFRLLETGVAKISLLSLEKQRLILILTLFIAAITCTIKQQHIAFRPITTRRAHHIASFAQLVGNVLMGWSAWCYRTTVYQSQLIIEHPEVYLFLVIGFVALALVNGWQLIRSKAFPVQQEPSYLQSFLSIPLYIYMACLVSFYFFVIEQHQAGAAVFFSLLFDQAGLFLNIGLYIWVGMLVKRTLLADRFFKLLAPWRLSAELLAFIALVIMAIPTAYTGASGIIIIAMGSVVFEELRRAGARRQLALAATAMTGSAGVVLRPCLLVVLIAALNKEVVTDQLFSWGVNTFATTALVFFVLVLISKREKFHVAPMSEALKPFLQALRALLPYLLVTLVVIFGYQWLLGIQMDEFSAPVILPVIILGFILYEKFFTKVIPLALHKKQAAQFEYTIRMASAESSTHIGALLMLMGLSFVLGGVIERSGLLTHIPDSFSSIWVSLGFLVSILVLVGMVMDPFGAVVLVSGTLAPVAYKNGLLPVHFWMITLVAFELGYLTPPVALNHLLTRQVVGHDKVFIEPDINGFWYQHERLLLPIVTMTITLLLVTIVPVFYG